MLAALLAVLILEIAVPADDVVARFEECAFTYTGGEYRDEVFKYRLLKPETIEKDKAYPVVLFLHGGGERGDDNRMQLLYLPELLSSPENRAKYPCFLIAPQCRSDKLWTDVNWSDELSSKLAEQPTDQVQVVMGILEQVLKSHPCDRRRVYLTGLSMGGYGTWELAMRRPEWFAAVAPICGGGDESQAARLVDVPVWAVHGEADEAVPVARSRHMIEAIEKAGGAPKYSELKDVGHNSWTPAYADPQGVVPWMFEQVNERLKLEVQATPAP